MANGVLRGDGAASDGLGIMQSGAAEASANTSRPIPMSTLDNETVIGFDSDSLFEDDNDTYLSCQPYVLVMGAYGRSRIRDDLPTLGIERLIPALRFAQASATPAWRSCQKHRMKSVFSSGAKSHTPLATK